MSLSSFVQSLTAGPLPKSEGTLRLEEVLKALSNPDSFDCEFKFHNQTITLRILNKETKEERIYYIFELINSADIQRLKIPDEFLQIFRKASETYSKISPVINPEVYKTKFQQHSEKFDAELKAEFEKCLANASLETKNEMEKMLGLISPMHKFAIYSYTAASDALSLNQMLRGEFRILSDFGHPQLQIYMRYLLGSIFYMADMLSKYHPKVEKTVDSENKIDSHGIKLGVGFRVITDIEQNSILSRTMEAAIKKGTNRFIMNERSYTSASLGELVFNHPDAPFPTGFWQKIQNQSKKIFFKKLNMQKKPIHFLSHLPKENEVLLPPGPMEYDVLGTSGCFTFLAMKEVSSVETEKKDYYPLQHAGRYAYDHYLSREYGFDFILLSLDDEKQLEDTKGLSAFSRTYNNSPLLIKYNNQLYIYGSPDQKEWKITKLDSKLDQVQAILKQMDQKLIEYTRDKKVEHTFIPAMKKLEEIFLPESHAAIEAMLKQNFAELKIDELTLINITGNEKINFADLQAISKMHNRPLLIQQGKNIFLYVYSKKEWKSLTIDQTLLKQDLFPSYFKFNRWDCSDEMRAEVELKQCHGSSLDECFDSYVDLNDPETKASVRVHRSNHGFAHACRQAFNIDEIENFLEKHGKDEVKTAVKSIKSDLNKHDILKIAALFCSVGRENESSFFNDPSEYSKMRARSSERFKKYFTEVYLPLWEDDSKRTIRDGALLQQRKNDLQAFANECSNFILHLGNPNFLITLQNKKMNFEYIINACSICIQNSGELEKYKKSLQILANIYTKGILNLQNLVVALQNELNKTNLHLTIYHSLNTAHFLDTPRCYPQTTYKQKLKQTLFEGSASLCREEEAAVNDFDNLWQSSCERIIKTGDRLFGAEKYQLLEEYAPRFVQANQNPSQCEMMLDFFNVAERDIVLMTPQEYKYADELNQTAFQCLTYFLKNSKDYDEQLKAFLSDKDLSLMMNSAINHLANLKEEKNQHLKEKIQHLCFDLLCKVPEQKRPESIEEFNKRINSDDYLSMLLKGFALLTHPKYSPELLIKFLYLKTARIDSAVQFIRDHNIDIASLGVAEFILNKAIQEHNILAVKFLCEEKNVEVSSMDNAISPFYAAVKIQDEPIRKAILLFLIDKIDPGKINNRETLLDKNLLALLFSENMFDLEIVTKLIEKGISLDSIDNKGLPAVCSAIAYSAPPNIINLLFEASSPEVKFKIYQTALRNHSNENFAPLIDKMLQDPTVNHNELFQFALEFCPLEICKKLMENMLNFNVNTLDQNRNTFLHIFLDKFKDLAPDHDSYQAFLEKFLLLSDKVDLTIKNDNGYTVLDLAFQNKFTDIAIILLNKKCSFDWTSKFFKVKSSIPKSNEELETTTKDSSSAQNEKLIDFFLQQRTKTTKQILSSNMINELSSAYEAATIDEVRSALLLKTVITSSHLEQLAHKLDEFQLSSLYKSILSSQESLPIKFMKILAELKNYYEKEIYLLNNTEHTTATHTFFIPINQREKLEHLHEFLLQLQKNICRIPFMEATARDKQKTGEQANSQSGNKETGAGAYLKKKKPF